MNSNAKYFNQFILSLILLLSVFSCKKEIEVEKIKIEEVEKQQSWKECERFTGSQKIFLSSGSDGNTLFFLQPFYFTTLTSAINYSDINSYTSSVYPANIATRLPISPRFTAFPLQTGIAVFNNNFPFSSTTNSYLNLKTKDTSMVQIKNTNMNIFKIMTIDTNDVLLLSYTNNKNDSSETFMMLKVITSSYSAYFDTAFTKSISIHMPTGVYNYGSTYFFRLFTIDNYFLVELSDGIYKIKEDGSYTRVHNNLNVDAFYKWQGKVYGYGEGSGSWDNLIISTDNGDSWLDYSGISGSMVPTSHTIFKDSLIEYYKDNIYTLKWDNLSYTLRPLKNDGLEGYMINGLEILHDTVYAATTSGLFYKPVNEFFESK